MSNKSKNIILFLFYNFSLSYTFFLFPYVFPSLNFPSPNIIPWPSTRVALATNMDTLTTDEGHMDGCYSFFAHYFFFFIVNLFERSHCHLSPSCYVIFFFWPNSTRLHCVAMHHCHYWPCGGLTPLDPTPCGVRGHTLLHGGVFPLLHRKGAANALRVL